MSPEIVLKQGTIVDVKEERLYLADLAIADGKILGIGTFECENEIDCHGKYIIPGLIDAHVHIESSMVAPQEFAKAILPHGTTTIIADPHELVNVKGNEAMEYLLDATENIPLTVYVMMPSSIPATPFETNGAEFTAQDMKGWIQHERVLGLGEVMCYPAVLARDDVIMEKIHLCKDMVIDGHAPGLSGAELQSYIEAGVMTDHECTTYEEAKEKCTAGMKILIREGSAARNLEAIVRGLVKDNADVFSYMFCTDDKHLDTIEQEGHINYNVKKAIELGIPPVKAVAMGSYYAAQTYGLPHVGLIKEGYDADLVILDSLEDMKVSSVYKNGKQVTDTMFQNQVSKVKDSMLHTVVLDEVTESDLQLKVSGKVPVIGMVPNQITTKYLVEEVPEENGFFKADEIYSKLCVLERHRGTGHIAVAPFKGYGITNGAIATSVAHDSHNVIVAGDNDADIILAINQIKKMQGGYVLASRGEIKGILPLPIAGLMSLEQGKTVQKTINHILKEAWNLGVSTDSDPFTTLSFMALPVIPELRLTDEGLVDVVNFKKLQ